ncbi:MAG: septum formation initiator family protein [Proteobacteria bacterium]|nr:septum formation initiator family protein [Pseudomonadota bacterium]
MQTHFDDDFEEVESPFQKSKTTTRKRSSHLFQRPLNSTPSEAPTFVDSPRRRFLDEQEEQEIIRPRARRAAPQVEYIEESEEEDEVEDEEEEEIQQRLPVKRAKPKLKPKKNIDTFSRVGWGIVGLLVLRLIFMERGVIDYLGMNSRLNEKKEEIAHLEKENSQINQEIRRLTLDKSYQRQITKETLGVIAADEFLILFAGESEETQNEADRPL